jgi:lipopolysaccharide/colanic/teichoic acid biosynthesis glycosyltransferase
LVDRIQISFHLFPDDWKQGDPHPWPDSELYPDLLEREDARKVPLSIKRAVDVVGSLAALIVGAPVMIAIAVAIKLTSKGPVLFRQERVGWRGSRFVFLKFRSMKCANDPTIHQEYVRRFIAGLAESAQSSENPKAVYKIQDDPRVTRVGKFLRRTSLDELPQFINVLKGEMSLVGPRPPIPYELEHYRVWHRRRVLEAKPGITGLWQVNGRSRLKFDDMVRLDLRYAGSWSLSSDLKVLLQTPRAALLCKGAY